jgi:hypothetical protein
MHIPAMTQVAKRPTIRARFPITGEMIRFNQECSWRSKYEWRFDFISACIYIYSNKEIGRRLQHYSELWTCDAHNGVTASITTSLFKTVCWIGSIGKRSAVSQNAVLQFKTPSSTMWVAGRCRSWRRCRLISAVSCPEVVILQSQRLWSWHWKECKRCFYQG